MPNRRSAVGVMTKEGGYKFPICLRHELVSNVLPSDFKEPLTWRLLFLPKRLDEIKVEH